MERTFVVILAIFLSAVVITAGLFVWRSLAPSGMGPAVGGPVLVTFDVTHVTGQPSMNSSDFWVARITRVTANASLSSYLAELLANGSEVVSPIRVKAGQLGNSTHPVFEFFDSGVFCSPNPCAPPEGPDGNLSVDDYFRISYPSPSTSYTIRVLWAATGEKIGEIVIET